MPKYNYVFDLPDQNTIDNLTKNLGKAIDVAKDISWNNKNISSQLLQGIASGESITKIADRFQNISSMNRESAIRNARTMTTSAECKGRQDSYEKATNDGVIMKRVWIATSDDRTRAWHNALNGEEVDIDEPFHNNYGDIMYPGDPSADPANVYNCRCSIKTKILGFTSGLKTSFVDGTVEIKTTIKKSLYEKKNMSNVWAELIQNEGMSLANKFYKELYSHGKPSVVWKQYLSGELDGMAMQNIEKILAKNKNVSVVPVKSTKKSIKKSTESTKENSHNAPDEKDVGKSSELIKAEKKLIKAQEELDALENKTYSGIWKDDVSLSDYDSKKNSIQSKKDYYDTKLQLIKSTIANQGHSSWLDSELSKHEKYVSELHEFETLGKQYAKAQGAVNKAKAAVKKLTPSNTSDAYSQDRKNNAKWFTLSTYKRADRYYTAAMSDVHKTATSAEHDAYRSYTGASGGFNRPLAGFDGTKGPYGSGWSPDNYVGVRKVPLNNEGKGQEIKDLTSFIEKSKTKDDVWIQTSQNFATLEGKNGFLGIDYGSLENMSDSQLQQFVGTISEFPQFISGSINRGGGAYSPGNMRINIYLPKGSEALYVLEDGRFGKTEHEIILQRGGTYTITKIYWGTDVELGGKKLMVDMDLLTDYGYDKFES